MNVDEGPHDSDSGNDDDCDLQLLNEVSGSVGTVCYFTVKCLTS